MLPFVTVVCVMLPCTTVHATESVGVSGCTLIVNKLVSDMPIARQHNIFDIQAYVHNRNVKGYWWTDWFGLLRCSHGKQTAESVALPTKPSECEG